MNAVEKAVKQIESCSCIVACKSYEDIEKALESASERGYEWIDGTSLKKVQDELANIDRSFFIAVYEDQKKLEEFFELTILKMNDQQKEMFLDKVKLAKKLYKLN